MEHSSFSPKKPHPKHGEHLDDEIDRRKQTHNGSQGIGDHIVGQVVGVAPHQSFLIDQIQNRKQNDGEQESIEQIEIEQNLDDRNVGQHGDNYPKDDQQGEQSPEERSFFP